MVQKRAKTYYCEAEFSANHMGQGVFNTAIKPETKIETKTPLTGETVLYGEVIRVGGADPKVRIKIAPDTFVNCTAPKEIAKEIGARLYTQVGLRGSTVWNPYSLEMEKFHIDSITGYEEVPVDEAFRELSDCFGHIFDEIPDIEKVMTEIRRGE